MKSSYDIVLRPVLTEKAYDGIEKKVYTFIVDGTANKTEIKKAIEDIFEVSVESVNTLRQQGKMKRVGRNVGRTASYKKAYVRLTKESKTIEFFEGMAQ